MIVSYVGRGRSLRSATSIRLVGEACGGRACVEYLGKDGTARRIAVKCCYLVAVRDLFDAEVERAALRLKEIARHDQR